MTLDVKDFKVSAYHVMTVDVTFTVPKIQLKGAEDWKLPLVLEVKRKRKKRSLSANAYAWVLCEKIAQKVGNTKEEVYRMAVHDKGVWDVYTNVLPAVERIEQTWPHQGLGWMTERLECHTPGNGAVILYYGSSTYSSEEMARLIDYLVDEADGLGIDTLTPNERSLMMEAWKHERA